MLEFHVDDHPRFMEKVNGYEYGGLISIKLPRGPNNENLKPIMERGQGECACSQHSYSTFDWVTDYGEHPLRPKSNGMTLMISAFQSSEIGFGYQLTVEQLRTVNEIREGQHYQDGDSTIEVNDRTDKLPLTESPF